MRKHAIRTKKTYPMRFLCQTLIAKKNEEFFIQEREKDNAFNVKKIKIEA